MFQEEEYLLYKQMPVYKRSLALIKIFFKGKKDKGGHSYMNHLRHVSRDLKGEKLKALGLMHDVLEDTEVTPEELKKLGYHDEFITAIKLLTNTYSSYDEYIDNLIKSNNKDALTIKLRDLLDNMDLTRLKKINENDIKRSKKYINAYLKIINKMEGEIIW